MTRLAALYRHARNALAAATAGLTLLGAAAPASADPALFVIKDADSTIYLLGTVHLLKPQTVWRGPKLDAALKQATELWLELPTTNPAAMQGEMMALVARYGLSPAKRLSARLTPAEMKTLDAAAKVAGLSGAQLDVFRPWFAALTISTAAISRAGYDPESGVDGKVEAVFSERGIKPIGFETAEQQIQVFASMSEEQELEYLRSTMEDYEEAPTELDQMVVYWAAGDIANLERIVVTDMKDKEPDLYQSLLVNRNANWVTKIQERLKGSGVSFIAVGAGHLIGPDSVLAMLKAKGVESSRVQ